MIRKTHKGAYVIYPFHPIELGFVVLEESRGEHLLSRFANLKFILFIQLIYIAASVGDMDMEDINYWIDFLVYAALPVNLGFILISAFLLRKSPLYRPKLHGDLV